MRNIVASLAAIVFLVLASNAYAVPREAAHYYEGDTYFQNMGAAGSQQTGNSGYLILQSTDSNNLLVQYFLWVDSTGNLRIASYSNISTYSSFPTGDWRQPFFNPGTKVGSQ